MDSKIIGAILAFALCIGFVWIMAMAEPGDGENKNDYGTWYQVRPPPHAPKNVECWVWQAGFADSRVGGPYCFVPE